MQGGCVAGRDVPRRQPIVPIHLLPTRHAFVARVGLSLFGHGNAVELALFQNWNKLA